MRFLCVVLTSVALTACAPTPAPLEWRIEFSDPMLLERAAVVEARILRGGCDGPEVFALEIHRGESMGPVPPPLDPGMWGFAAEARDERCARFASHCQLVVLPGTSVVVNRLAVVPEMQVCSAARCARGSCASTDADMDGSPACVGREPAGSCDCNDARPDVLPGAADPCEDGIDQDCDDADDECDADCDGYPSSIARGPGADCDDGAIDIHPNERLREVSGRADGDRLARGCEVMPTPETAVDRCTTGPSGEPVGDGRDQDCNGFVDDGPGCTDLTDRDRDGARACGAGMTSGCDIEDCDPGIGPGRDEICGNDVDEDADGRVDSCAPGDLDGDGHAATAMGGDDCDDTDPRAFPGAPDDCRTPEAESCGRPASCTDQGGDADDDGYLARPPPGARGDCDDADDEVHPFAGEDPCDGVDQDCDGVVDEIVRARPPATPGQDDGCVRTTGGPVPLDYDLTTPATQHCGGCGVATADDEDCCLGVPTAVDEPTSCGSCGFACGPHTTCASRGMDASGGIFGCECVPDATGTWDDCNGSLRGLSGGDGCESDLSTDGMNCGMCGNRCGANQSCVAGVCTCAEPYRDCDGEPRTGCEINSLNDVNHCGTCGTRCTVAGGSAACVAGACELVGCDPGFDDCNTLAADGCETALSTLPNCGRCGEVCASVVSATEICSASGTCDYTTCDAGFLDCSGGRANGCETNGRALPNCGSCGNTCAAVLNAVELCAAPGTCDYSSCDANFGDCDSMRGNGCEVNLRTSTAACGTCAINCATTVLNASGRSCGAGVCNYTACTTNFADCDLNRANGCEVDVRTTLTSCGACATNCSSTLLNTLPAGRTCAAGVCNYATCAAGNADCDGNRANGCERNITTTAHCGACGNACGAGETCNGSGDCACGATSAATGPACTGATACTAGVCM